MASLSIRKLNDSVYKQLQTRAAQHGVSMEEEARQIISHAVTTPNRLSNIFRKNFGSANGIDLDLSELQNPYNPLDFQE